jgi:hypothetical protein
MDSIIESPDLNSAFKTASTIGFNETAGLISRQINGLKTYCNGTTLYLDIFAPFISSLSRHGASIECLEFLTESMEIYRLHFLLTLDPSILD